MAVYKEIQSGDGSGVTTFYRISSENATVETDGDNVTETMFDYNQALNKPSINGVALVGDKDLDELGIQPAGDYITAIPSEYITEAELDKYDEDIKKYIIDQINNTEHFHREVVEALPLTGKDNALYMVPKQGSNGDVYNEYIWTGATYELIGTTATDLSDYYKKNEITNLLDSKVDKVSGKQLSTNDYTSAEKTKLASLENYDDTEVVNDIAALETRVGAAEPKITTLETNTSAMATQIEGLDQSLDAISPLVPNKINAIRLIKSGDEWIWQDVEDNILTFAQAQEELGHENTILILEKLEMDGKIIPDLYASENDVMRVVYTDKDDNSYIVLLNANSASTTLMGKDAHMLASVDTINDLPATAKIGDIRVVGDSKLLYIYDGTEWVDMDKGGDVDLSNYLAKDNTIGYTPGSDYNPATKKYVDDSIDDIFIPTKVSQLSNDSGFVTKAVSDLNNYYPKTNTYNKAEVNALVSGGGGSDVNVTLNGVSTTNPSFYAPLTAGTSGQVLKSNGSGAPVWGTVETGTLDYNDLENKPDLKAVATTGSYTDLTNQPDIPTKTSDLTNDSDFTTKMYVDNLGEQYATNNYIESTMKSDTCTLHLNLQFNGPYWTTGTDTITFYYTDAYGKSQVLTITPEDASGYGPGADCQIKANSVFRVVLSVGGGKTPTYTNIIPLYAANTADLTCFITQDGTIKLWDGEPL